jgi:hypothetical protein
MACMAPGLASGRYDRWLDDLGNDHLMHNRRSRVGALCGSAILAVGALSATAIGAATPKHPKHRPVNAPSGQAMPVGNQPGWKQVFRDNFTGTTISPKWNAYRGAIGGGVGGWWAASHAVVRSGELVLKTYQDPTACTDAAICPLFNDEVSGGVKMKLAQTYGKYLIRVRTTPVADTQFLAILWPAVGTGPPETDFAVEGGPLNLTTIGAMIKYGPTATTTTETIVPDSVTANPAQWHTLGVVWSPGSVTYSIDGTVWATEANPNISSAPMNLVLQSQTTCEAVPGHTCTAPWATTEPNVDVDWVVAYTRKK